MGEVSSHRPLDDWEQFASRWLACLLAMFVRCVRSPALAHDLATETLAAAEALTRMAPSPPILAELRLSGLVDPEPLPDLDRHRHDA